MTQTIRVLIVADNLLARAGLAALLDNQEDCLIVGQTTTHSLIDDFSIYRADILLVDLGWQAADSLDSLRQIEDSALPLVALITDENDAGIVLSTLDSFELYGLLLNEHDADLLMIALQTVYNGLLVIDPALSSSLISPIISIEPLLEELTARENQVLQLLAQGLTNKGIAHQLGITDHTVKFHVNAIMTKLGAQSRTDAVVRASRGGLIIL
jgi:two-component system, NarL family, nitrate/nitrite response regulator NarL